MIPKETDRRRNLPLAGSSRFRLFGFAQEYGVESDRRTRVLLNLICGEIIVSMGTHTNKVNVHFWRRALTVLTLAAACAFAPGCASLRGPVPPVCDLSPISLEDVQPATRQDVDAGAVQAETVTAEESQAVVSEPPAKPATTNAPPPSGTDYRVQPLDALRIDVYGEPDISGVFPVSAEGDIRHPLLASVQVAGMSVADVERRFADLLGQHYLVNPRVGVRVEHSTGRRVTILGEIQRPGTYSLPPEQPLTLLGLVATAGGFTDIANPSRVRILRDTGDIKNNTIRVNVNDLLKGRLEQTDITLLPGDVVMIPEAIF